MDTIIAFLSKMWGTCCDSFFFTHKDKARPRFIVDRVVFTVIMLWVTVVWGNGAENLGMDALMCVTKVVKNDAQLWLMNWFKKSTNAYVENVVSRYQNFLKNFHKLRGLLCIELSQTDWFTVRSVHGGYQNNWLTWHCPVSPAARYIMACLLVQVKLVSDILTWIQSIAFWQHGIQTKRPHNNFYFCIFLGGGACRRPYATGSAGAHFLCHWPMILFCENLNSFSSSFSFQVSSYQAWRWHWTLQGGLVALPLRMCTHQQSRVESSPVQSDSQRRDSDSVAYLQWPMRPCVHTSRVESSWVPRILPS